MRINVSINWSDELLYTVRGVFLLSSLYLDLLQIVTLCSFFYARAGEPKASNGEIH